MLLVRGRVALLELRVRAELLLLPLQLLFARRCHQIRKRPAVCGAEGRPVADRRDAELASHRIDRVTETFQHAVQLVRGDGVDAEFVITLDRASDRGEDEQ